MAFELTCTQDVIKSSRKRAYPEIAKKLINIQEGAPYGMEGMFRLWKVMR